MAIAPRTTNAVATPTSMAMIFGRPSATLNPM
jgi:hypothetical protein